MRLAFRAGHHCAHGAGHLVQAIHRVAPTLEGFFLQLAAQTLMVAVDLQCLASNDLYFVIVFIFLLRQINDLAGKTRFGFRVGGDVFQFGGVGHVAQRTQGD